MHRTEFTLSISYRCLTSFTLPKKLRTVSGIHSWPIKQHKTATGFMKISAVLPALITTVDFFEMLWLGFFWKERRKSVGSDRIR